MSGVVHCRQCKAKAIGSLPDAPPADWEVVLANKVFGGGASWALLCRPCRGR